MRPRICNTSRAMVRACLGERISRAASCRIRSSISTSSSSSHSEAQASAKWNRSISPCRPAKEQAARRAALKLHWCGFYFPISNVETSFILCTYAIKVGRLIANDFNSAPCHRNDRILPIARNISNEQWSTARRIARELDKVLDSSGPKETVIARAAAELRLTTRQGTVTLIKV